MSIPIFGRLLFLTLVGLLNHQVIGVDWMLGREESSDEGKGGILADSMVSYALSLPYPQC